MEINFTNTLPRRWVSNELHTFAVVMMKFLRVHSHLFLFFTVGCLYSCEQRTEANKLNMKALSFAGANRDSVAFYAKKALMSQDASTKNKATSSMLSTINLDYRHRDSAIAILKKAKNQLAKSSEKTGMANLLLGHFYVMGLNKDSALYFFDEAERTLTGSEGYLNSFKKGIYNGKGIIFLEKGDYTASLEYYKKTFDLSVAPNGQDHVQLADVYLGLGDLESALHQCRKALHWADSVGSTVYKIISYNQFSLIFEKRGLFDSALYYNQQGIDLIGRDSPHAGEALYRSAKYLHKKGEFEKAIAFYLSATNSIEGAKFNQVRPSHYYDLGISYSEVHSDSALFYFRKAHQVSITQGKKNQEKVAVELLANQFRRMGLLDSAYHYISTAKSIQEETFNSESAAQLTELKVEIATLGKEKELQAALAEKVRADDQRIIVIISSIALLSIFGLLFLKSRQQDLIKSKLLKSEKKALEVELSRNKQLLSTQTLSMIHKNNGFQEIAENLQEVNGSGKKIKKIIDINMALEKDWNNFNMYFSQVHDGFYDKLKEAHPTLSNTDLRLCALVKLGLKIKEISTVLNVKYDSIAMSKYRIKKKLKLPEELDVDTYITQI